MKYRLDALLLLPQASDDSEPRASYHYPDRYREVVESLQRDLSDALVVVGAGILGKKS
jgi:hypothetical protein